MGDSPYMVSFTVTVRVFMIIFSLSDVLSIYCLRFVFDWFEGFPYTHLLVMQVYFVVYYALEIFDLWLNSETFLINGKAYVLIGRLHQSIMLMSLKVAVYSHLIFQVF